MAHLLFTQRLWATSFASRRQFLTSPGQPEASNPANHFRSNEESSAGEAGWREGGREGGREGEREVGREGGRVEPLLVGSYNVT